jgi:hypothetical protein
MSKQTTAVLSIGPLYTTPFGDNSWRVSSCSQLVEGGVPYWLVTPTQPAENFVTAEALTIEFPDAETVISSVIMVAAVWHGSDDIAGYLLDTENLTQEKPRSIAPYWELSQEGIAHLSGKLSQRVKLGFTLMDDMCLIDTEVISRLRQLGFFVEVFVREPQLSSAR